MRFHSTTNTDQNIVTNSSEVPIADIRVLLEMARRLAAALPICSASDGLHPLTRTASIGIARAEVRRCIAALATTSDDQKLATRQRLSKAIISIHNAPNESIARRLYDSPQVQDALWAWGTMEAGLFISNLTRNTPPDRDKLSDLVGDAVMGFVREQADRANATNASKLNPFSLARTWDQARMPDALGTLRSYLMAWCKNVTHKYQQQRIHEGVSLSASDDDGNSGEYSDRMQTKSIENDKLNASNPEGIVLDQHDHQAQAASMRSIFNRQLETIKNDIMALNRRSDAYSANLRLTLQNRFDAITTLVAPLLDKLERCSEQLSAAESDQSLDPAERKRQIATLQGQFDDAMRNLTAISEAQERAHGSRITREEQSIQALQRRREEAPADQDQGGDDHISPATVPRTPYRSKKIFSDPLTTQHNYQRARENAERLLPNVYRVLTQRKTSDLSQKYTANLLINHRILDGINSQTDMATVLSPDPAVRSTASPRALFSATALKTMMILRDHYTHDEKFAVERMRGEDVPKSAKQRFIQLMGHEIERDPALRAHAQQQLALLKEFVVGAAFRTMWDGIDSTARIAAYESARNEKIDKRWSDLTTKESNQIADEAGNLLYNNAYRPFASRSLTDAQNRATRDLDLTPTERQQIMRDEAARITQMMRGEVPRGPWAHGEPADSKRFHDKLRAVPAPATPSATLPANDSTIIATAALIRPRRFANAYHQVMAQLA